MDQAASAYQAVLRPQRDAVKTQIWTAVASYVLVAIVKKELQIEASLYQLLQILSVTLFEKMSLQEALTGCLLQNEETPGSKQLTLNGF